MPTHDFYIDRWLIQPALNQIVHDGEAVRIPPKYMEVLLALAANPGEVCSRETLLETVWADTYVVESVLSRAIFELRKVFGDDAQEPQVIETIIKGGYRLIAPVHAAAPVVAAALSSDGGDGANPHRVATGSGGGNQPPAEMVVRVATGSERPRTLPGRWLWVGVGLLILVAGVAWWGGSHTTAAPSVPTYSVRPITALPGRELDPALSPEGNRVVFTWLTPDDRASNGKLYLKHTDAEQRLPLTEGAGLDRKATWSPDGASVAFVRASESGCFLMEVAALGGPVRQLAPCPGIRVNALDWSPDGRFLVVGAQELSPTQPYRLFLFGLADQTMTPLTDPPAGYLGDTYATFSPDGKTLAFGRGTGTGSDLYLLPVQGGALQRLTYDDAMIFGIEWMPDGKTLRYGSERDNRWTLWEIDRRGGTPTWAGIAPEGAGFFDFTLSDDGQRLAYATQDGDLDVWQWQRGAEAATPLLASSRADAAATASPDGQYLAFYSWRRGAPALWRSSTAGEQLLHLHTLEAPLTGTPRWSPDGTWIAYSDVSDLFVISSEGGPARRLTTGAGRNLAPQWGPDGEWLYFSSNRAGRMGVWRVPAAGGEAQPITHHADDVLLLHVEAAVLYFVAEGGRAVWQQALGGGEASVAFRLPEGLQLESWVFAKTFTFRYPLENWAWAEESLYFVTTTAGRSQVRNFDFTTAETSLVLERRGTLRDLALSADEQTLLFSYGTPGRGDVYLVEWAE